MTGALSVFVLLYSGMLGLWAVGCAMRRAGTGVAHLGGLILLELMLLLRAGLEGGALWSGRQVAEPTVHAAYLVASVALLPLVLGVTRAPSAVGTRAEGPWDSAVTAVACLAVAVVAIRMNSTGSPV